MIEYVPQEPSWIAQMDRAQELLGPKYFESFQKLYTPYSPVSFYDNDLGGDVVERLLPPLLAVAKGLKIEVNVAEGDTDWPLGVLGVFREDERVIEIVNHSLTQKVYTLTHELAHALDLFNTRNQWAWRAKPLRNEIVAEGTAYLLLNPPLNTKFRTQSYFLQLGMWPQDVAQHWADTVKVARILGEQIGVSI